MGKATHLLTQKVTFQAPVGKNTSGDPTYGALRTVPCRFVRRVDQVRSPAGITMQESTVVCTEVPIPANSLVWLGGTGGDRSSARFPQQGAEAAKPFGGYTLYETRL